MKNILITGATGLIGSKLIPQLKAKGYSVSVLSRSIQSILNVTSYVWDVEKGILPEEAVHKADCIVHLAGANVGTKKWTAERKQEIISSRAKSGNLLLDRIKTSATKPACFITASAVGYYGLLTSPKIFTENDAAANDFFGEVGKAWESILTDTHQLGMRSIAMRIGVVLAKEGGALPRMMMPLRFGFNAPIGSGKQYIPWIHIDDMVAVILKMIEDTEMKGAYNIAAPEHSTNTRFMKTLCKIKKSLFIPIGVPAFLLRLLLGDQADIVLTGSRVSTDKLSRSGYKFQYPDLESALKHLV